MVLTDHDTTDGWVEAAREAKVNGMRFVPGVEITCNPAVAPEDAQLKSTGRGAPHHHGICWPIFRIITPKKKTPPFKPSKRGLHPARTVASLA